MKRTFTRTALSLLLIVVLMSSLMGITAFAASGTVGTYLEIRVFSTGDPNMRIEVYETDDCPPGLRESIRGNDTEIWLSGTPTEAGSFTYAGEVQYRGSEDTEAKKASFSTTFAIGAASISADGIAAGAETVFENAEEAETGIPTITKQPRGETVEAGGPATFIANHTDATWAVWYFISPDGKTAIRYDQAEAAFPGLEVYDGMYSTMSLHNIPLELDGWNVACEYRNDAGAVRTEGALITVTPLPGAPAAEPFEEPEPTATPAPTEAPEPTEEPEPTTEPVSAAPAATPVPAVQTVDSPDYTPLIIRSTAAVVSVLAVCGTIIYLNRNKTPKKKEQPVSYRNRGGYDADSDFIDTKGPKDEP